MRALGLTITILKAASVIAAASLSFAFFGETTPAANAAPAPYRASGNIPGTELFYDKLKIDGRGRVTVTISNPDKTGKSFAASFNFYTEKDAWLTGFSIEGFAGRMTNTAYALNFRDHKKLKKASYMKVLGRAGRTGDI